MNNKRTDNIDLFSIDVEAHLQKLAANTYRSPHHYPVELIRLAIKRGAKQIQVKIKAHKLEILDDGRGIKSGQLDNLITIFNGSKTPEEREKAIESMKTGNHIGLLAIFSPAPKMVEIETVGETGNQRLKISAGRRVSPSGSSISKGSRIILLRDKKDWLQEFLLLQEYLRGVPQKITINNVTLAKKDLLTHPMVSMKIPHTKGQPKAWIGIPHVGDICRIWLMDQHIPWHYSMITPWRGFIFEAAIEYNGPLTRSVLDHLVEGGEKLYLWLAKRYSSYPPVIKKRIEDLFFKQNRLSIDSQIIDSLHPFKMADSDQWFCVSELKEMAVHQELYAIPDNEDPSQYNLAGKTVLSLSKPQVDFLVNYHQVPIRFLSAVLPLQFIFRERWNTFFKGIQIFFSTIFSSRSKVLNETQLDHEEQSLLHWLTKKYSQHKTILPGSKKQVHIIPRLTNSRGISSTAYIPYKYAVQPTYVLLLRRKHPDLQLALNLLKRNPENIEIIGSLFIN